MKGSFLAITLLSIASNIAAQSGSTVPMSLPGPMTPADGPVLVSVDLRTNEAVARIPGPGGSFTEQRFELHNNVAPTVRAEIVKNNSGAFTYTYQVSNSSAAKSPISTWSIEVAFEGLAESFAEGNALRAPDGWNTAKPAPPSVAIPGSIRPTIHLAWNRYDAARAERVSTTKFALDSTLLPGIVWSFARGTVSKEYDDAAIDSLPADTAASLRAFLTPAVDGVSLMTIGPKFRASDPKELVASEFFQAFVLLSGSRGDSPFLLAGRDALAVYMGQPEPGKAVLNLEFLAKAATPFEAEIAGAIRASLAK